MGTVGWSILILAVLAAALFGLYRWAMQSQSVALLDRADAVFTASAAQTTGPIAFGDDPDQVLVVSTPTGERAASLPVIVFIHGGSWAKGNAPDYAFAARNLAAEGYVAVSAGYRLVPGGEYPAMLEDGAAAVRWVADNIAEHGGDPTQIVLMGHSAGAYNAVMLALDPQWLAAQKVPADSIKGAIGLAGPYDFLPFDSDSTRNAFGGASDPQATQPINFVRGDAPPLLLVTGDADVTVRPRNSQALAKAMTAKGQPTEPVLIPEMGHSGIIMALAQPFEGDRAVKTPILEFLKQHVPHS